MVILEGEKNGVGNKSKFTEICEKILSWAMVVVVPVSYNGIFSSKALSSPEYVAAGGKK